MLITIAAAGAFLTANPAEGAAVLYLYAIAEFLEEYAAGRAHRSIASLLDIAPQTARVRRDEGEVVVPVSDVRVGETVLARPGDTIPLDGVVTLGESSVDQAPITGESVPVAKGVGDAVYAGTRNMDGYLEIGVTKPEEASTISRVVALVAEAQAHTSPPRPSSSGSPATTPRRSSSSPGSLSWSRRSSSAFRSSRPSTGR